MKYNKNADTLLFLLLFTTSQREKILKKHYMWVQALEKVEKQRVLGVLYHNIYRIFLHKVYLSYFQMTKKLKRFH